VDHIDHPIHNACKKYRAVVPLLLKANPLVASQKDAHGVYPVQLFCENYNRIDISVEEYANTIDLFLKCDPNLARRSFWRRPSLEYELKQVLSEAHVMNCIDDEAPTEASVPYGFGLLHWN
jgi:phage terminase small subunit